MPGEKRQLAELIQKVTVDIAAILILADDYLINTDKTDFAMNFTEVRQVMRGLARTKTELELLHRRLDI